MTGLIFMIVFIEKSYGSLNLCHNLFIERYYDLLNIYNNLFIERSSDIPSHHLSCQCSVDASHKASDYKIATKPWQQCLYYLVTAMFTSISISFKLDKDFVMFILQP